MHDDLVWPNRTTDRPPVDGQTGAATLHKCRYRYRTDLPLRRDAGRRRAVMAAGALRIHETVETRLCSSFRRTDTISGCTERYLLDRADR